MARRQDTASQSRDSSSVNFQSDHCGQLTGPLEVQLPNLPHSIWGTLVVAGKVISFLFHTRVNCSVLPEFAGSVWGTPFSMLGVNIIPTKAKQTRQGLCNLLGYLFPCSQLSDHSPGTWHSRKAPRLSYLSITESLSRTPLLTTLPSDLTGSQDIFTALHSLFILWFGVLPTTQLLPGKPPD